MPMSDCLKEALEMLKEWPDSSGNDDHGRDGGGSGAKDDGSNFAKGAAKNDAEEAKHGIKPGDTVHTKDSKNLEVMHVSGNSLTVSPKGSTKIMQVHATKVTSGTHLLRKGK